MKNPAPYRYDIVGSFLRTAAVHEARTVRIEYMAFDGVARSVAEVPDTLVQQS